jgi:hypothetical protein
MGLLRRETFVPQSYSWAQEAEVGRVHARPASTSDEGAKSAEAGTSTRPISGCTPAGSICIVRSIAMAPWLMRPLNRARQRVV